MTAGQRELFHHHVTPGDDLWTKKHLLRCKKMIRYLFCIRCSFEQGEKCFLFFSEEKTQFYNYYISHVSATAERWDQQRELTRAETRRDVLVCWVDRRQEGKHCRRGLDCPPQPGKRSKQRRTSSS